MAHWIIGALVLATAGLAIALVVLARRLRIAQSLISEKDQNCSMLLDYMVEGVLILDSPNSVRFYTGNAAHIVTEVENRTLFTPIHPDYEALLHDLTPLSYDRWPAIRAFRGETVRNELLIFRHMVTGDLIYRNVTAVPFISVADGKLRVFSIVRDDTHVHRTHEARLRLASIVESSDDAIISTDTTGLITSWNRGAERMYGYTAAEMMGRPINRLIPSDGFETEATHIPRLIHGETLEPFAAVRLAKDGHRVEIALSTFAIRDTTGAIIGTSGIARDITATRALEHQLIQSQKMEAIGQLTGGIAHDFNNLLAIIIGNLELIERTIPADSPVLRRAQTAQRAAARCADLTKRLLAFSSSEHLTPRAVHLEHSVRNILEMAVHALGPDIDIAVTVQPHLPPIFVDPSGFESALLNLIINARDAMPRGGNLAIEIQSVTLDDASPLVLNGSLKPAAYALVSVADQGHGMTREVLDRAFEPFFTTKERGRGTGLGLPMVYGFARQSGGTVTLESEPALGTTVRVYVPFAPMPDEPPGHSAIIPTTATTATILLVDDEAELLDIAADFLSALGFRILRAENAVQALRTLSTDDRIDLIITDILMPGGVNGVELAQTIADLRPSIKVLYTSGFPAAEFQQRGVTLPAHDFLRKPYRLAELRDAIHRALNDATPSA